MKNKYYSNLFIFPILLFLFACQPASAPAEEEETMETERVEQTIDPAVKLVDVFIDAMGGMDAYRALKDVEYTYARSTPDGIKPSSLERYLYPSEWSWAQYTDAANPLNENEKGELIQAYINDDVWVSFNGELVDDPKALQRARFARKTNFYWLNMFFKMRDPGLTYQLGDSRKVADQTYETVKVSFEDNVGDAKDVYLLYVNTDTKLVDYFLFTVMEFDRTDPIMMKVKYEQVGGLMWPTYRASTKSDWDGKVAEDAEWSEKYLQDLKVNSEISHDIFKQPK